MKIQEGKQRMKNKEYSSLGGMTVYTIQGWFVYTQTQRVSMAIVGLDQWKVILYIAKTDDRHTVMTIRISRLCTPKKWLESTTLEMPSGTWIVMEGWDEKEEIPLFCICCK